MRTLLTVIFTTWSVLISAQSPEWDSLNESEQEVMRVVIDVFDGMREADSAKVKSHFYPQPSANTAFINKEGEPQFKIDDISNWFNAIGKPHDQVWDERIWDYQVQIDLNLAAVWVRYGFYLDKEFHHCGVDAIQLAHDGSQWRIFHLADTRQEQACEIPERTAQGATY